MSMFGDVLKRLRAERDVTLEEVAQAVKTHKGYISGIENGKVRPPSVRMIEKLARFYKQDPKPLVRLAWVDKAPSLLRSEAHEFLKWIERGRPGS